MKCLHITHIKILQCLFAGICRPNLIAAPQDGVQALKSLCTELPQGAGPLPLLLEMTEGMYVDEGFFRRFRTESTLILLVKREMQLLQA